MFVKCLLWRGWQIQRQTENRARKSFLIKHLSLPSLESFFNISFDFFHPKSLIPLRRRFAFSFGFIILNINVTPKKQNA